MSRAAIVTGIAVFGVLLLSSCTSVPRSSVNLVRESAAACARYFRVPTFPPGPPPPPSPSFESTDEERCYYYADLRLLRDLEPYLEAALRPRLTVTPLPCPADGPGCGWQQDYDRVFRSGFEHAFGDPHPQPSKLLPFDAIPAQVQLERTVALRDALAQAVTDLDDRIEVLREAVQQ